MRIELLVEGVDDIGNAQALRFLDLGREPVPELLQQRAPVDTPVRDRVELLLQVSGELVLHIALEEVLQEGRDNAPAVFRQEAFALQPNIVAVLQDLDDRGVGGGAADAELLQPLDQTRLRIARRRLGEMLLGLHRLALRRLAFCHGRQGLPVLVIVRPVVLTFTVELQEPVEADDRAGRPQYGSAVGRCHIDGGAVEDGGGHLAGDGALPDQLVKPEQVRGESAADILRAAAHVRGPDRLMRFLGIARRRAVAPGLGRQVGLAELAVNQPPRARKRLAAERHAVRAHIGDEAHALAVEVHALVELLS